MTVETYKRKIGLLIQETRQARGFTQGQLAKLIGTSQSAINRIEKGGQNVSLEMVARISEVLSANILTLNQTHKIDFRVHGGNKLSGSIDVKTSKNAAVCLLCAALLNHNTTILHNVPHIEEVNRIIEVLQSINVKVHWVNNDCDIEINPPAKLDLTHLNNKAASRTRSILLLLGALIHQYPSFKLPFSGGCKLGKRTVEPHLAGLAPFGLNIVASNNYYNVTVEEKTVSKPIILVERSDTATENVLMAAALYNGEVTIRNASPNYMVQDLCFFLEKLGVKITGIGTTTLVINGLSQINKKVDYYLSEDPIEAMSFIAAAVVTDSEVTIRRAPIEFLEIELAVLKNMGLSYSMTDEYKAKNGKTRLVDLTIHHSKMIASKDKLHSMPFPGVNMDNLPLMGLIATVAKGQTLVHDWSYENRAIYFTELTKLNGNIELVDPHRVYITGPTNWHSAEIVAPAALRPSVVILLAMLAAPGTSLLLDAYSINRGYEELANRLNSLGADIETVHEI